MCIHTQVHCYALVIYAGPEPPTDVSVAVMDSDTVVVSWTASQSRICDVAIVKYHVKYGLIDTGYYSMVNTSGTCFTLQGLTPHNTEYSVSVAAVNSIGNMSALSTVKKFHTVIPGETTGYVVKKAGCLSQ